MQADSESAVGNEEILVGIQQFESRNKTLGSIKDKLIVYKDKLSSRSEEYGGFFGPLTGSSKQEKLNVVDILIRDVSKALSSVENEKLVLHLSKEQEKIADELFSDLRIIFKEILRFIEQENKALPFMEKEVRLPVGKGGYVEFPRLG